MKIRIPKSGREGRLGNVGRDERNLLKLFLCKWNARICGLGCRRTESSDGVL